jgi:hypothetical protein
MQVEYSTDLVFRSQAMLAPLYDELARQAVLNVKAEHVATFLGHKIIPQLAQEIGSRFATRIEGTCIKHRFGKSAIKMYDKFTLVLRLKTTTNNVSSFKHHRQVWNIARGRPPAIWPRLKRPSTARPTLARSWLAAIVVISPPSLPSMISRPAPERLIVLPEAAGKTVKGINFFNPIEQRLLRALQRPAFNIAGIRRAHLLLVLDKLSPATVSRLLTRLRTLGLIKRVSGTYRYYLTPSRQQRCRLTEQTIIPALA